MWREHFLFLKTRASAREAAPLILNTGGPYEGHPRDRIWQDFALEVARRHGLSIFYDGLNPHSGIGGDSPMGPVGRVAQLVPREFTMNNTGGLLKEDWSTPRTAKLDALVRARRLAFAFHRRSLSLCARARASPSTLPRSFV